MCHSSGLLIHEIFYKKLRIWARTENFLKLSDFESSGFLTIFMFTTCALLNPSKLDFLKLFQCFDISQVIFE